MSSIHISIRDQTLSHIDSNDKQLTFPISSAKNGIGAEEGSYKTPSGEFRIDEKHGYNAPINTIFKGRQPQGLWNGEKDLGDLVLTRILWLTGTEPRNVNTKSRYIYIHGTNHENFIGSPQSCGCIRMKNQDVITLYDLISIGTPVKILP